MLFLNVSDSEIFEMVFFQLETEQLDLIIEVWNTWGSSVDWFCC